jgi:hypothetical protein
MKKQYILFAALLASSITIAWQKTGSQLIQKNQKSHFFSAGGQSGLTGAPGESNCTQCHVGSVQNGATQNTVMVLNGITPVTSYVPGTTYNITLDLASNPAKSGFSATILNGSNAAAGTSTGVAIGGTQGFTGGGRNYVSHTSTSNLAGQWGWQWTAPATDMGPVRIYIASNATNSDDNTTGDVIYTSSHIIGSAVGLNEEVLEKVSNFNASFSPNNSTVYISYTSLIAGKSTVNIVDMNGRSALFTELDQTTIGLNKEMIKIPENIKNGMYVIHYFVNNVASSKTISIQR